MVEPRDGSENGVDSAAPAIAAPPSSTSTQAALNDEDEGGAEDDDTTATDKRLSVKKHTDADMANLGKRARKRLERWER